MSSVSKNVYIDKLDDIVNKHNNTYSRTITIKPVNVKSNKYINSNKEINNKNPKFKIGYTPNWSEESFVIKKIKSTVPWTYVIYDHNEEEIVGIFYEKELQKANQKEFRIEKVIRKKDDKLYVKWIGHDNSFNSWIDKKDIV